MTSLAGFTPTHMVSSRQDRIEPRGTWTELIQAINRSQVFSDVDELDIWEWLLDNPHITRITQLDHGLISDLIPTRIMEHTPDSLFHGPIRCADLFRTATVSGHVGYSPGCRNSIR